MAKITNLEQKTFQGKPSGFKVTLDNGTTGNLQEKESDKGLRVGDEVIVTLIPYTSKAGVTSNLLGLKLAGGAPQQSAPAQAPRQAQTLSPRQELTTSMKFDARLKCIQIAHDAFLAGKLDDKEAQTHCREWVVMSDALIDDLNR